VCLLVSIICEWLGLQQSGQTNVLGSYSGDHSSVIVNGLTVCGASEAAGISKVANSHGWIRLLVNDSVRVEGTFVL
jgi:hypothetical protein